MNVQDNRQLLDRVGPIKATFWRNSPGTQGLSIGSSYDDFHLTEAGWVGPSGTPVSMTEMLTNTKMDWISMNYKDYSRCNIGDFDPTDLADITYHFIEMLEEAWHYPAMRVVDVDHFIADTRKTKWTGSWGVMWGTLSTYQYHIMITVAEFYIRDYTKETPDDMTQRNVFDHRDSFDYAIQFTDDKDIFYALRNIAPDWAVADIARLGPDLEKVRAYQLGLKARPPPPQ